MTKIKKELIEWVITISVAVAVALFINMFGGMVIVEGLSMTPTLNHKDILIRVSYRKGSPKFGDIIAFKTDLLHPWSIYRKLGIKKALVKRVIGLPGDHIVVDDGSVYRNGEILQEDYIKDGTTDGKVDVVVPDNRYFVMGDNRLNSNDSRRNVVGLVKRDSVIGKVKTRLFPFNNFGSVK